MPAFEAVDCIEEVVVEEREGGGSGGGLAGLINIDSSIERICMLRAFGVLWWWLLLGYGGFVGGAAPGVCEWGAVARCSLSLSTAGQPTPQIAALDVGRRGKERASHGRPDWSD